MCCRCPPLVGLLSYIYILLTVVVAFYFQHAKSIHLENSIHFNKDQLNYADIFNIDNINLILENRKDDGLHTETINNFSFDLDFHEENRILLEGTEADTGATKTQINNKSFCKIMDNYIYYHIGGPGQRTVASCPLQAGFYEIYDNPEFNDVDAPNEMPVHSRTSRLELIRHGEKIACKQFQFIRGGHDKGLWEENDI
ncbi:uncharacterized protein LOC123678407 [Harmonia axyridis]|uniref:uncharacterized protein LOC123678407 n=1 Tax=Harmonia axyridis TaxID=115357 RepID=UPI001E27587E|nr:uncharacterized protein LOC123678407 [Harmonia axyridis]